MGEGVGCGGDLGEIERSAVGEFSLDQAVKVEELAEAARTGKFGDYLIRLENLLANFPRVNVLPIIERRGGHGSEIKLVVAQGQPGRGRAPPPRPAPPHGGGARAARPRVVLPPK